MALRWSALGKTMAEDCQVLCSGGHYGQRVALPVADEQGSEPASIGLLFRQRFAEMGQTTSAEGTALVEESSLLPRRRPRAGREEPGQSP